jgi:hypothetical protein
VEGFLGVRTGVKQYWWPDTTQVLLNDGENSCTVQLPFNSSDYFKVIESLGLGIEFL